MASSGYFPSTRCNCDYLVTNQCVLGTDRFVQKGLLGTDRFECSCKRPHFCPIWGSRMCQNGGFAHFFFGLGCSSDSNQGCEATFNASSTKYSHNWDYPVPSSPYNWDYPVCPRLVLGTNPLQNRGNSFGTSPAKLKPSTPLTQNNQ